MLLLYVLIALAIGSVGSILLAGGLLFLNKRNLEVASSWLLNLAGGTLLGAAFLGMLPRALKMTESTENILNLTLAGIVVFFVLEKLILWRICGNEDCERHKNASAQLILFGDALHNFIDGVIIATAFLSSYKFGILVTLSVFAHELPQELADFGVLLSHGYSKIKSLVYNLLSGMTTFAGGLLAFYMLEAANKFVPYVLAFSAASFIYIALADLVPQLHKQTGAKNSFFQVSLIITGIIIIFIIKKI